MHFRRQDNEKGEEIVLLSERGFYLSTTSSVVLGEAFEELGLVQALWPFVIIESINWCVWSGCEESEKEKKCVLLPPSETSCPSGHPCRLSATRAPFLW